MKTKYIIISLLIVLICLVLVDIFTGIFYWNRMNLLISSENFNNIVTPIATSLAFIVYLFTLFYFVSQNKLLLSQSLKPFYNKQIDDLIKRTNLVKVHIGADEYSIYNYIVYIKKLLDNINDDDNYKCDLDKYNRREALNESYFEERTYSDKLAELLCFIEPNEIFFFQQEVVDLILNIKSSKMIKEDKELLVYRLNDSLLKGYLDFIKALDSNKIHNPLIPLLPAINSNCVEFKKLNETKFRDCFSTIASYRNS